MTRLDRVFRKREHADRFLAGQVRFGHLGYYRSLEDAGRGDPGEGRGHHHEYRAGRSAVRIAGGESRETLSPGMVSVHTECGNDVFICCLTLPPDDDGSTAALRADRRGAGGGGPPPRPADRLCAFRESVAHGRRGIQTADPANAPLAISPQPARTIGWPPG